MTEAERLEAIRKWAGTPARNPDYEGATPADVARALLLPRDPKLQKKRLAAWKNRVTRRVGEAE